ncbi:MAG: hypothetical protein CVT88_02845 [Candidatus Altiarchaeales archaeon HGW-Altiarchaeales-1]|nr:MAG: hypothetical protein CVT88_02845 [Candidatus Altiarchaeales archaeon HGW-Altiarchaeales-1]
MAKKSIIVKVNPEVLKWLRESSGWTCDDVSIRLKTKVETFKDFELGTKSPTLRQLKELSLAFNMPLAAFLLPKRPEEKPLPLDYRMLPNKKGIFDKKTMLAIRKARSLQSISKELSDNIQCETKPKIERVITTDNPEDISGKYREIFKLTEEKQRKFRDTYQFFNYLRALLEDMNILIFQISMPVEDARGFSLSDDSPAILVVNTKDSIEARLFSLMHEFAHILRRETVIDLPELSITDKENTEKWCDEFASSFLLPKETAKKLFETDKTKLTWTETINALSGKYKLSKSMLLYNMYKLDYLSKTEYNEVLKRYKPSQVRATKKGKQKGGGIPSEKRCISEVGSKFVSLVADNFDKRFITYSDALNYLSVKSKSFDKVLTKAGK